ncbi:pyrrolo-quinoline quinone [Halosimplex carlsbadense 2-9-1]|uniref:Pyrrolo-quinoline quinone n=1 Tax=Halosimplex carlsbadense 2-9-1 TaxID=797114 RepID=M0D4A6_9EURY|nr:PQQ-binding-like beta-propeller repeat protein [Halosimplex carlsbadense]ELZ30285.1 pyrrolo-quinoline quinone [Halosimplex carlsbadense 2-9-1]
MDERQSRRAFLGAAGAAIATGLAGCVAAPGGTEVGGRIETDGEPLSETATAEFRGGLQRRGVYPEATIPTDPEVDWTIWEVNTGDHTAAKASPVEVPGGDIVVPGDNGEIRRVTPAGEEVWRSSVDPTSRGVHGTPAVANGVVYVGAYDGALYAFDLESGERYWRSKLGDAIGSSPGYHDGTVYIAVEYHDPSGAMFAVDAVTGDVTWEDQRVTDHPHSTAAIDREAGRLVVGSNDGSLYGWSYPGLEYLWTFPTGEEIKGPIATADGSAVFGSWDRTVYRVSLDDGTEEWSFETDDLVMSGPSIEVETGTVYVGSHDSHLYALAFEDGAERWSFDTGGSIIGCPTVTSEHVVVGAYDDTCYAVEKASGDEVWSVEGVGVVTCAPLVTDDAVYFTDRAATSYLDAKAADDRDADPEESGGLYRIVDADG